MVHESVNKGKKIDNYRYLLRTATSFPESLFFPPRGARGVGKKRDPENEVVKSGP